MSATIYPDASSAHRGVLLAAHWTLFNNKVSPGGDFSYDNLIGTIDSSGKSATDPLPPEETPLTINNLLAYINAISDSAGTIAADLASHVSITSPHGAVSAATANRMFLRDSIGGGR